MRASILAVTALLPLAACAEFQAQATAAGVPVEVQNACAAALAQSVAGIDEDTDFDVVKDELADRAKACLIASVQGALLARIVPAPAGTEGEVIAAAGDARASIALAE